MSPDGPGGRQHERDARPAGPPAPLDGAERLPETPASPPDAVRGVRLGVDVGTVRVGVAVSDPDGVLASPLVTLDRDAAAGSDLDRLAELVRERSAVEVVVGLPRSLSGGDGPAARAARAYAAALGAKVAPVPVRLVDERLTTVAASRTLTDRGISSRRQRRIVDQAAATLILQGWLEAARTVR